MSSLGIRKIDEMVGRTDLLEIEKAVLPWKAKDIDLSRVLYKPEVPEGVGVHCSRSQDHAIDKILDLKLVKLAAQALEKSLAVKIELPINNADRTCGAMLSGEVCRIYGEDGLPEDTVRCKFKGIAGQSFGAFLAKGVTFELEGMANDYVGKGISGGKVIIYPDKKADYRPQENIIIGNTTFYGAINGEAYIRGVAGERFCIRNSGLYAVVEGVGDHACEYMTGGRVVILGATGRNFAAGMSGGIAYVYSPQGDFKDKCNLEMVELGSVSGDDETVINELIRSHYKYTQSETAKKIMDNFKSELKNFVKVMPLEYKRILETEKLEKKLGLEDDLEG